MPCVHLKQLYHLCKEHEIRIGGLDMVRLTCNQCNVKDVCPSVLVDEFDFDERQAGQSPDDEAIHPLDVKSSEGL